MVNIFPPPHASILLREIDYYLSMGRISIEDDDMPTMVTVDVDKIMTIMVHSSLIATCVRTEDDDDDDEVVDEEKQFL